MDKPKFKVGNKIISRRETLEGYLIVEVCACDDNNYYFYNEDITANRGFIEDTFELCTLAHELLYTS